MSLLGSTRFRASGYKVNCTDPNQMAKEMEGGGREEEKDNLPRLATASRLIRIPVVWRKTSIPVFHFTRGTRTISLNGYHQSMFPALTTFLD